jgi:hypothetical protein
MMLEEVGTQIGQKTSLWKMRPSDHIHVCHLSGKIDGFSENALRNKGDVNNLQTMLRSRSDIMAE